MKLIATKIYELNAAAWLDEGKRRAINEGGTASSKTYSVLQLLILIAMYSKRSFLISVTSESLPHLKRGCIRDFFNILGESQENNPRWNKTDHIYTFGKGVIEFFGADEQGSTPGAKQRGGRRQVLFVNEANNVAYPVYRELDTRTELFTFLDFNPVSEFWVHENGLIEQPENVYIHSTYQDALSVLPASVVTNIESNKDRDPNWWNVYGLGLLGKIEGLVYPYFEQVDVMPKGEYFYGLDFGFSADPAVLTRHIIIGDALYSEQLIYECGLTNQAICRRLEVLGLRRNYDEITADSAEPKSIEEIHRDGWNIKPCDKGPGSVDFGQQKVLQFRQHWTKGSVECIREQRNFRFILDRDGKLTDKTNHNFSHGMDSRRYAVMGKCASSSFDTWNRYLKKQLQKGNQAEKEEKPESVPA